MRDCRAGRGHTQPVAGLEKSKLSWAVFDSGTMMTLLRRERSYVRYRWVYASVIDNLDFFYRLFTRQLHLPPYSLRTLAGGSKGFKNVGPWFLHEFFRLGLFKENYRILDVGCGCGRVAYCFATDPELLRLNVQYAGMDIDAKAILWCQEHVASKNTRFQFYCADLYNRSYNPKGKQLARDFRFPHPDGSFDLIIATSLFTHLLEEDLRHYLRELFRMTDSGGTIYASFFTYRSREEAVRSTGRHPLCFPCFHGHFATHSGCYPENAIAYEESFLLELIQSLGFRLRVNIMYGTQDILLLAKLGDSPKI